MGVGQFPLHQLPVGVSGQGQLVAHFWTYSPFSALDLLNWKSQNPSYQYNPKILKKMAQSTDLDQEAPENTRLVNTSFTGQSTPSPEGKVE